MLFNLYFFNYYKSFFALEYLILLVYLFIALILSLVIISASYFLTLQNPNTEKLSSYECGFEPYENSRHKFEVRFYLVAILFLLFDIETMFLLPWSISLSQLNLLGFWSMLDFILELALGFLYLWYVNALDWNNVRFNVKIT